MNQKEDTCPMEDEFEILELGTVSEETRGGRAFGIELFVGPNSRSS
ncbi:MAG: hypothetical protein WA989_00040 [Henriciella sp.]